MLVVVGIDVRYPTKNWKRRKGKSLFPFLLKARASSIYPFVLVEIEIVKFSQQILSRTTFFSPLLKCIVNLDVYLMPSLDKSKLDLIQFIQMGYVAHTQPRRWHSAAVVYIKRRASWDLSGQFKLTTYNK